MLALSIDGRRGATVRRSRCRGDEGLPDWRRLLPREWTACVVEPSVFSRFRDYEIVAERVLGYAHEGEDAPCYCEHYVVLTDVRSDDDESYYLEPTYGEHLVAWRLIDGRWLIHRRITHGEDCQQHQAFFSFADEMPR